MRRMDDEPKKRGRRPKPEDEKLVRVTMFFPPDVKERVKTFGQEWARKALRRAPPPKPKKSGE